MFEDLHFEDGKAILIIFIGTLLLSAYSDESIISHWMILNRYLLFCVYLNFTPTAGFFRGLAVIFSLEKELRIT